MMQIGGEVRPGREISLGHTAKNGNPVQNIGETSSLL